MQTTLGEHHTVPGSIVCVQPFGSVTHEHPHLHVPMTDGGFRHDGRFVPLPEPDPAVLEALWQRAVLAEFLGQGWLEEEGGLRSFGPHACLTCVSVGLRYLLAPRPRSSDG